MEFSLDTKNGEKIVDQKICFTATAKNPFQILPMNKDTPLQFILLTC